MGRRKMGRSSRSARGAGIESAVVVDFFPAYDDDGGLLSP
jgi:hypothetical protein